MLINTKWAINRREIVQFFSYLKGRRIIYWITLFSAVVFNAVMNILTAYVNKGVFNAVSARSMEQMNRIAFYGVLLIVISCIYPITRYWHITVVRHFMFDLKIKLFRHLECLNMAYFDQHHSGDSIQRLSDEVDKLKTAYFTEVFVVISSLVGGITSLATMFFYDFRLAVVILLMCLASIGVTLGQTSTIRKISNRIQAEMSRLTQNLSDILAGFGVVKLFAGSALVVNRYLNQNTLVASERLKRIGQKALMEGLSFGLVILSNVGIIVIGVFMVLKGYTDYGTVMAVITLQYSVSNLFLNFGKYLSNLQISMASAARVFEVLDTAIEPEKYAMEDCQQSKGYIQFNSVSFCYENRKHILTGLNLSIHKGQKVALIGPSGGGKSTLLKLLLGFYPSTAGGIIIDGKSFNAYSLKQLRALIGYVPQNAYLFEGTIKENIRFGKPEATETEIVAAAQAAYAHDFISEFPLGYETEVTSHGQNLSGGQRQRIAIARAFLRNAPILLLDEATSALDNESEVQVQKSLTALMENRTVIIVAHRLTTIEKCDAVYVIKNGRIAEVADKQHLEIGDIYSGVVG
ncbi:MAG TPA: ABC transporter ATP-binding protein [Bacillota bacterium]|nr:ABC transporter ATP-binding protein [Bacillota bacterium]